MVYEDIPRIYTALAEWGACMVYCFILKRKQTNKVFGVCSISALVWLCTFLTITADILLAFWLPCMFLAAASMFLYLWFTCDVSKITAGYCTARAFLLAEFAASLEWQLECYLWNGAGGMVLMRFMLLASVYGLVFAGAWYLEKASMKSEFQLDISMQELWSALLIVLAAFLFSNLSFIYQDTPFSSRITADIFNVRTMVDLGGIAVLYAFQSRIYELKAEREFASINTMLKSQYDHYRHYQESIDIMNMKYHDLKHQIAGLRAELDAPKRTRWLDAMEKEIQLPPAGEQIGNHVLDTVLTGKQMYCRTKNIGLTYVADGKLLEFIHVTDICTIFGNALDNAIESVILVEDPEKRLIHLSVSEKKNFVFILVENYCDHKIELKNGYPVTTKPDKTNHGFGLKSIRYSAEKYHGSVTFDVNKNWFQLKILIPIQ